MNLLSRIQKEYSFTLPDELIARYPSQSRDDSRLMHLPSARALEHRRFHELPDLLQPSDILVWNDTLVEPRRVPLKRKTGASVEALFLERLDHTGEPMETWECMIRNASRIKQDEMLLQPDSKVEFQFRREATEEGQHRFFLRAPQDLDMHSFFMNHGEMPIPPYLGRKEQEMDRHRYQTVYAKDRRFSSAAAPTAGLHFSSDLIERLRTKGIRIASVQLAVGPGTFAPLTEEQLKKKSLHSERFCLPPETAHLLNHPEGRIIAIGTTTLRALESNLRQHGRFQEGQFQTEAFFHPPDTIQSIQGLITNFHLPASSLILLVAAFAGKERVLQAYKKAVENKYRFYSYGDAMLVFA